MILLHAEKTEAGRGHRAKEQQGLSKQCELWRLGDKIPEYLLKDSHEFNYRSMFKPSNYIKKIDNIDLLFNLNLKPA